MKEALDVSFTSEEAEEGEQESESEIELSQQQLKCPSQAHTETLKSDDFASFSERVKTALAVDPVFAKLVDELIFN